MKEIVEDLCALNADEMPDHKVFLKENMRHLFEASGIFELFGEMNMYWNYLSYDLLAHLIEVFGTVEVKGEMEEYKSDLEQFRDETPIKVFCKAQEKKRMMNPPDGFEEMVTKFTWPENVTLSKVEEFRQAYICNYNLLNCTLLLNQINIGSFSVVWFIARTVVDRLSKELDEKLLTQFAVSSLEIGKRSLYLNPKPDEVIFNIYYTKNFIYNLHLFYNNICYLFTTDAYDFIATSFSSNWINCRVRDKYHIIKTR